jgi:hypothetical protein
MKQNNGGRILLPRSLFPPNHYHAALLAITGLVNSQGLQKKATAYDAMAHCIFINTTPGNIPARRPF